MKYEWFEELPKQCPPKDAKECCGVFYRIAEGDPATSEDFFSQRKMNPHKVFKGLELDECIVRAISLFSDVEDAKRLLKLPKFKNNTVAEVNLIPKDGLILKTFKRSHFSWWRTIDFDVKQAKVIHL